MCIATFCHLMTTLLNIAIPEDLVNLIGWLLIIVASGNILGNLGAMIYSSFGEMYVTWKRKFFKHKIRRLLYKRLQKRQELQKKYDIKLTNFEMNQMYLGAIESCKDWHEQRKWLIANGIDYKTFKEEELFR